MACKCATTQQLNKLDEQFGQKREVSLNESFWFRVKNFFMKVGVGICVIFAIPYLIYYILRHGIFGDGKISVAHFFGFREKIVK